MPELEKDGNKRILTVAVTSTDSRMRLDKFLAQATAGMPDAPSRSRLQELIHQGEVHCQTPGTGIVQDPSCRVKPGDRFLITLPRPVPAAPQAEKMPLRIVYEDAALLVIDKPAGLVVHPGAGNRTGTLVNGLLAHCGDSLTGIGGIVRPGIVHRLDKETSGLLVVAKTEPALKALQKQFAAHGRDGRLQRTYTALVWGAVVPAKGCIHAPIGRSTKNRTKMDIRKAGGREAVTHYRVLQTYGGSPVRVSALECRLETGRTHQIRLHLSHIGHPVLGDRTYGRSQQTRRAKLSQAAQKALEKLGRQALHAGELGFEHPETRAPMHFCSPLPDDIQNLRNSLESTGLQGEILSTLKPV